MKIEEINNSNSKMAYDFLCGVPSIDKIDEMILSNAVLAIDNNKIVGCISFEKYDSNGLIRYFVFKKAMPNEFLELLLNKLEENALKLDICKLVCIADNKQIEDLFISLGFNYIEERVYINEEKIENTSFKDSRLLYKKLSHYKK